MKLIMVIDDEKDTRETMRLLLVKNGYKVIIAKNVDKCLKRMENEKPDLILLDLLMEGKSVDVLIGKFPEIKFIIVSAYISENLKRSNLDEKLMESLKSPNVVGRIAKPFDNDKLLELVKKNLK